MMVENDVVKVIEEVLKVMEKKVMTEVCEGDGRCSQGYGERYEGDGRGCCWFKIWLNNDFDK